MRCLDVDVPVGDEECARVCREILNTCIRNTEEAERVANARRGGAESSSVPSTPSSDAPPLPSALGSFSSVGSGASSMLIGGTSTPPQSALTSKKSVVWGMIDESELAKGVRRREKEESIGERAKGVVETMRLALDPPPPSSTAASESLSGFLSPTFSRLSASFAKAPSPTPSPSKPPPPSSKTKPVIPEDEFTKAKSIWEELGRVILNITGDPASAPSIPLERKIQKRTDYTKVAYLWRADATLSAQQIARPQ